MKVILICQFVFISLFTSVLCQSKTNNFDLQIQGAKEKSVSKFKKSISDYSKQIQNPRSIDTVGNVYFVPSRDWTSGFYPGCLWYEYELSNDTLFKNAAIKHSELVEKEKLNGTTHDMGFKIFCSYGNGYRLTKNVEYKNILLQSAKTLITRFNPKIGCIRSWDHNKKKWDYPVIVDNMMNLELLMWAFNETADSVYYNIAVSHANTTMKNHFRSDFSSYHVIDYDTITGNVIKKNTHQGFAHESAWARGQTWGLYGYTMMYRYTKNKEYLHFAEKIAQYYLNHKNMPDDLVPYWDFDAPDIPNTSRDASAAAVAASALIELSSYSDKNKIQYRQSAEKMLFWLCSDKYFAGNDAKHSFLLEHSTGNVPENSEIDTPIIYADYYFLEALLRLNQYK